jgi:hypothetical protein
MPNIKYITLDGFVFKRIYQLKMNLPLEKEVKKIVPV